MIWEPSLRHSEAPRCSPREYLVICYLKFWSLSLSILLSANFSQPEIMLISNRTENSDINLTCSSIQGYPKPKKMYFLLKTMNSTSKFDTDMKIIQDTVTELYNVSISLSFPVFPETNVSIFCVLQHETTQTPLLSQPYNIGKASSQDYVFYQVLYTNAMTDHLMTQETSNWAIFFTDRGHLSSVGSRMLWTYSQLYEPMLHLRKHVLKPWNYPSLLGYLWIDNSEVSVRKCKIPPI